MPAPDLSEIRVIVPVRNGGDRWREVAKALALSVPSPAVVAVVDSSSTDGSDSIAAELGFELERIDVQVTMPDAKELCARLEAAGYQLRDPIDLDAFAVASRRYTSGLSAMAEHLGTPEAPLLRPHAGSGTQRLDKTCASHDP